MTQDSPPDPPKSASDSSFWQELKRRHVARVALTYVIVSWIIIQVAVATFAGFGIPDWAFRFVVLMLLLGFPIALILAWAFEMTPDGIKTTKSARKERHGAPVSEKQGAKRNWTSIGFAAALPTVIFGALALYFYFGSTDSTPDSEAVEGSRETSIAVLAFENMSDDKGNEFFSDGISEELLNVLAKSKNLRVPARTSSFYFKGKNMAIQEIGKELDVAYVLEGSVRKSGLQVRITAQLIDVENGYHLWSETFDRDLKNIFALQDEIAGLIAAQLKVELGIERIAREVDPEAHSLVLEGRFYWNLRGAENFDRAADLVEKALEIDPDFAQAHALMTSIWSMRATYKTFAGDYDILPEIAAMRLSASRALELDPTLVEPYAAMGYGLNILGEVKEAGEWFEKGRAINVVNPTAPHWYAEYLVGLGHFKEAKVELELAFERDPKSFVVAWVVAGNGGFMMNDEETLNFCVLADSLRPGGYIPAKALSSILLWKLGRKDEAIEIARAVRQSWGEYPRLDADTDAIWVLREAGLDEEVSEYFELLSLEFSSKSRGWGVVLLSLHRFEEARILFENAQVNAQGLMYESSSKNYSEEPGFISMLKQLGLLEDFNKLLNQVESVKSGN
ncbi:MAG: TolB-like protein/tetratricopeptide (TPR) repeat protein [Candidatus Pelagisphaera sp.]|jgi:TolB-like protein/tetratricopeptide (TPR) repeat protein